MHADRRTPRRRRSPVSSVRQRERVHEPGHDDAAEKEATEDEQKEFDALLPPFFPQQREVDAGGHGVDEHQDEVVLQQAHSFRPSAMSNESSISRRFISPAVTVNAVPCSYVIEVMSPWIPMASATKYMIPEP